MALLAQNLLQDGGLVPLFVQKHACLEVLYVASEPQLSQEA